jgi:aspartate beta-hydroxylase
VDAAKSRIRRELEAQGHSPRLVRFWMKYLHGSGEDWAGPHQRTCNVLFPNLRPGPFYPPSFVGGAARALKRAYPAIRAELDGLLARSGKDLFVPLYPESVDGRWDLFYFADRNADARAAAEAARLCPKTSAVIGSLPDLATKAFNIIAFARLASGSHVRPHCGYTNLRVRLHLGLRGCGAARIRVGGEVRAWKEGELLAIDDSFEHETWNDGSEDRYILIVDLAHPDLTPAELAALARVPLPSGLTMF